MYEVVASCRLASALNTTWRIKQCTKPPLPFQTRPLSSAYLHTPFWVHTLSRLPILQARLQRAVVALSGDTYLIKRQKMGESAPEMHATLYFTDFAMRHSARIWCDPDRLAIQFDVCIVGFHARRVLRTFTPCRSTARRSSPSVPPASCNLHATGATA